MPAQASAELSPRRSTFLSSVNLNDELFLHNLIPLYCSYVHNVLYYTYIVSEVFLTILTYKLT